LKECNFYSLSGPTKFKLKFFSSNAFFTCEKAPNTENIQVCFSFRKFLDPFLIHKEGWKKKKAAGKLSLLFFEQPQIKISSPILELPFLDFSLFHYTDYLKCSNFLPDRQFPVHRT
jgi:hypothetical protein